MSLLLSIGNNSYLTEDAHSTRSPSWRQDALVGEKKAENDDKLSSSLHWILGEMRLKKNSKVTCRSRDETDRGTIIRDSECVYD